MIRTFARGFGWILIAGLAGAIAAWLVCYGAGVFDINAELAARAGEDQPTAIELQERGIE